jgi:cyclohexanone monooxygenase
VEADLVCDGWTDMNRRVLTLPLEAMTPAEIGQAIEAEDFRKMNRLRARIDQVVERPEVAEALKPWYRYYCKRPTFSDDYLPTFNRENVTLVDVSASQGVERLTAHGVVANGTEYPVDCVIFASGFEVTSEPRRRIGIPRIEGRGGRSLYDHWRGGLKTLHGLSANGFPNIFFTGYTQVAISANFTSMLDEQCRHIVHIVGEAKRRGAETVEPTPEAEAAWGRTIRDLAAPAGDFWQDCTPGYYNNEGGVITRSNPLGEDYAPGVNAFNTLLEAWRAKGDLEGLALGPATG